MDGRPEVTFTVHGLAVDNGQVRADVFIAKFRAFVDSLKIADKHANEKRAHEYIIVGLETHSAEATVREKVAVKKAMPASSIQLVREVAESVYNGDRNVSRFPRALVESLGPWVRDVGTRFSHAEVKFDNDDAVRIDDFLASQVRRAVRRVRGEDIEPEQYFAGVAIETLDGTVKELDARGALVRGKLVLTVGGKEIDCVFLASEIPALRESFNRRARVQAVAHYDGQSLLPVRLDVKKINVVSEQADLLRWKGALRRPRNANGL